MTDTAAAEFVVYWQPGCTSCLATREFLARHGIAFRSVDVRADPAALAELLRLGARSVPVVARGGAWVYAQSLDELARFVGVSTARPRLDEATLALRVRRILEVCAAQARRLPAQDWERPIPGRDDRCRIDIPFHVAAIVEAFLDTDAGGELLFEYYERRPRGAAERTAEAVAAELDRVARRFVAAEAERAQRAAMPARPLRTYFGVLDRRTLLERTAWHIAQHARQLQHLLESAGVAPEPRLEPDSLEGLPLPAAVWDPEIGRG